MFRMSETDLNKSVEDAKDEPNERTPLLTGGGPVYNTPRELIESCSLSQYVLYCPVVRVSVSVPFCSGVGEAGEKQVHIWHVKVIILVYLALVVIARVEI